MHESKVSGDLLVESERVAEVIELHRKDFKTNATATASNVEELHCSADDVQTVVGGLQVIPGFERACSSLPATNPKSLINIPTELQIKVFTFLDAVDATCLAITCKPFYAIYLNSSKTIGIELPVSLFQVRKGLKCGYYEAWSTGNLLGALYQWIGSNLVLNVHISKLVTRERDKEIFDTTFPDGWHSIDLVESVEQDIEDEEEQEGGALD